MKTVAIVQPSYLGWMGFFDLIDQTDTAILLDTVPVAKQSWQTRNKILDRSGNVQWLSLPIHAHRGDLLKDIELDLTRFWWKKHRRTLEFAYGHLDHFPCLEPVLECLTPWRFLSDLTSRLVRVICEILGIETRIINASTYSLVDRGDMVGRIMDLCRESHATEFLEPAGGKALFGDALPNGVPVRYHEYSPQPYLQGKYDETSAAIKPFVPYLSIVDALPRLGPAITLDLVRSGRMLPDSG